MTQAASIAVDASTVDPHPDAIDLSSFAPTLIAWQREHGRHALPWQQLGPERDAYRVWLAEIMLQQTQVAAVIPYYQRFVERFPTVEALASASTDDVMQQWSGLGYYSRARNLQAAAKRVVAECGGRFPDTVAALELLPGIGRSTAGAIVAFAHGKSAAILDGNVKRVLARIFLVEGPPSDRTTMQRLWALSEALLPRGDVERDFGRRIARYTQGLMDLGATVCTPRNPACLICPFESTCLAHREGREDELPRRAPRQAPPSRTGRLLLVTRGDEVLLQRRPAIGIWGGLWSLPEAPFDADDDALAAHGSQHGSQRGKVASISERPGFVHGFTHFVLHASIVHVRLTSVTPAVGSPDDATRWVAFDALGSLGLPTPIRKFLNRSDVVASARDR